MGGGRVGERWIIDLDARQAQARAHLASWVEALADTAASIRGEVGAESPSLAVADAVAGELETRVHRPGLRDLHHRRPSQQVFWLASRALGIVAIVLLTLLVAADPPSKADARLRTRPQRRVGQLRMQTQRSAPRFKR